MVTVDLIYCYPIDYVNTEDKQIKAHQEEMPEWRIITSGQHTSTGLNLHGYLAAEKSFYSYVINEGNIFCNSKKMLIQNYHYIPSAKDKDNNNIGSIFGCTIILKNDLPELELVKMVLTITTYGREFIDESKDELSVAEFEKLFRHNIINIYLKLIESEIAQMFVRHGIKEGYINVNTGELDMAKIKPKSSQKSELTPV